jgi:catechol 2,3-dioxygenase-like lactoylglutathione lyase family enzyme
MARIQHIAFFTEDAERMAKFYCEVFGMKVTQKTGRTAESGSAVFITDGYMEVALIEPVDPKSPKGINHFGFTIDPAERGGVMKRLAERGISPITPPKDRPYIEDAVKDVDGNKFDISTTGLRPQKQPADTDAATAK